MHPAPRPRTAFFASGRALPLKKNGAFCFDENTVHMWREGGEGEGCFFFLFGAWEKNEFRRQIWLGEQYGSCYATPTIKSPFN